MGLMVARQSAPGQPTGAEGTALVHDLLISAMTTKQIAESRGMAEQEWERYFTKRLGECLNCLAVVYGFSNGSRMLPWK